MNVFFGKVKYFGIVRRWHWRLDFLWRESASRSKRLKEVIEALAQIETEDGCDLPVLFLDGEAETRFLLGIIKLRLLGKIELRKINCMSDIYLTQSTFVDQKKIYMTGSLFAKYHIVWLNICKRKKLIII